MRYVLEDMLSMQHVLQKFIVCRLESGVARQVPRRQSKDKMGMQQCSDSLQYEMV